MEKDIDNKLYDEYLDGEESAFEFLYNKYKGRVLYFIYNIIKDYQKSEDLAQETFIYIMKNPKKENISFKYYIYLVAKSKAFNYRNVENRRNEIINEYIANDESTEKDVLDIITKEESRKELMEAIALLDEKYKNAIYLIKIENLTYKEAASILEESISNTKSLVYRGKKQLRKIMLKSGVKGINKLFILIICSFVLLTGISYAGIRIYNEFIKKQDEVLSRKLFDLGDGHTDYAINLMANDMVWNAKSKLYHRIIDNSIDYEKYKERIDEFPNIDEINFDENFVVIIANENIRQPHEKDLTIFDIEADENTTYIIMKQKDNPNYDANSNIWYAIVDRTLLRKNVNVSIKQRDFNTRNFKDIKELPQDYSIENAIQDGCIVINNNRIISNNGEEIDKFVEDTDNDINSFIRVVQCYRDEFRIRDLEYYEGIYYLRDINLVDREKEFYNSYTNRLRKSNNKYGTEYSWESDNDLSGAIFVIIQQ